MSGKKKKRKKDARIQDTKPEFKILIYEAEYKQIQEWTKKYPDLETGGDLFGLWRDDRTAVIQLVLGPGKRCRRTATSFYQDVDYLDRVGNHLTNKEGLCHIGEWHSHHKLGLTRPSGGDENTVWSNMHRYEINRFCLFISTIDSNRTKKYLIQDKVRIDGYLFEIDEESKEENPILTSKFECMKENSPFRAPNENEIREGAESLNERNQNVKSFNGQQDEIQPDQKISDAASSESSTDEQCHWLLRICKMLHVNLCVNCIVCK